MNVVVEKARIFATAAHAAVKQTRKYTNEPYINHPIEVAAIITNTPITDWDFNMIAAALLHDVVEDTGVTIQLIQKEFGEDIADLVGWLTDVSTPEDGNRAQRKRIDLEHTAASPARAQTIKLADLISNTQSIVRYDPNFAEVYLKEKQALLKVLTKGDPTLWEKANDLCVSGLRTIEESRVQLALGKMEGKV